MPIEINGNLYFTQHWNGEFSLNFMPCFNYQNDNFSNKTIEWNNFFLILIYLLLQLKIVHVFPLKFLWITSIQIALLLDNWPPQCIAIDHTSIGLKRVTIQLVVSEACRSVLTRFSRHNTSQVCTATLTLELYSCGEGGQGEVASRSRSTIESLNKFRSNSGLS